MSLSQYLTPEPLLRSPNFVAGMAMQGLSTPAYAYAGNRPLRYVDYSGLDAFVFGFSANAQALLGVQLDVGLVFDLSGGLALQITIAGRAGLDVGAAAGIEGAWYPTAQRTGDIAGWGNGLVVDAVVAGGGPQYAWNGPPFAGPLDTWHPQNGQCVETARPIHSGYGGGFGLGANAGITGIWGYSFQPIAFQ